MSPSNKPRPPTLLTLPPELRLQILSHALTSPKPLVVFVPDSYQRETYQEATQPPLTLTNRQIRSESLPVFYACNDFILHTDRVRALLVRRWLQCIAAHLGRLRRLTFWIRYLQVLNDRSSAGGALSVSMMYSVRERRWVVDEKWRWLTVVRKREDVGQDGDFLVKILGELVGERGREAMEAEEYWAVLEGLRERYGVEKMGS